MSAPRRVSAVAADERVAEVREATIRANGEQAAAVDAMLAIALALPPELWKPTTDTVADKIGAAILLYAQERR